MVALKTPPPSDLFRQELQAALRAERALGGAWLDQPPGVPLAQEARSALALRRLAGQAPVLLARPPASPAVLALGEEPEAAGVAAREPRLLAGLEDTA